MTTARTRLVTWLVFAAMLSWLPAASAEAQDDTWSFVFTPQVWLENIPKSGFSAASNAGGGLFGTPAGRTVFVSVPTTALETTGADPKSTFYPQWGGQFAAQRGPWTFGVGAQYVRFETTQDFFTTNQTFPCFLGPNCGFGPLDQGKRLFTEVINTDRLDVDVTATYRFADVVKDRLDVTTGLGFKWIRASGHRELTNRGNTFGGLSGDLTPLTYFLEKCGDPAAFFTLLNTNPARVPSGCLANRASFLDQHFGLTIPTTLNVHILGSGKLMLPIAAAPFIGYETRTDEVNGAQRSLAYGGTFDAGLRYVFDNGVAAYVGYRGQAIQGNDLFFAHGPLFNMSIRF
jgi:hypothetical protein